MQKLVTRRVDLLRSIQTGVPDGQSEGSDSPWTSGSAANQKGGTRSQRGQPRQIKCWTCIHPRKSSPSTSAGVSLSTCASTPAPFSQRSRGAFSRRGDLLLPQRNPGKAALSLGFKQERKQASKQTNLRRLSDTRTWSHDSAGRRFAENDETEPAPELPEGRLLSGR